VAALAVFACAGPARAADPERDSFEADPGPPADVPAEVTEAREDLREELGGQGLLTVDDSTGAVHFLAKLDGFLDSSPSDDPEQATLDYLTEQAEAFGVEPADIDGLRLADEERSDDIQSLEFTQAVDGVPIIDSSLQAHLDEDGRLLAITGGLVPDPTLEQAEPTVSEAEARDAAAEQVGDPGDARPGNLVAYSAADELRLAWRMQVNASSTGFYDTLVDATTGEVVRRTNLVKFAGQALVYDGYPGAPGGGTASPRSITPYLAPGADRLIGPNAHAFVDPGDLVPGPVWPPVLGPPSADETRPNGSGDFIFPFEEYLTLDYDCRPSFPCSWDPKDAGSWATDSDQAATQLFWHVNKFHDHLEDTPAIGFDAESGNFEDGDRLIAQAQDGADTAAGFPDLEHSNNANMLVLPDGASPRMQMYLWDPIADADPVAVPNWRPVHGGDDPSLVYHEYAHGLTNRLVTDANGWGALNGAQAGAIDEGTADWYALDYLVEQGLTGDAVSTPDVTLAPYEVSGPTGLRTQPIDCLVSSSAAACPSAGGSAGAGGYTYGDLGRIRSGAEVHDDGEIWAQTLWQLRGTLVTYHGATEGVARTRRLVTDALRMAPPNPTFLDMRNAILIADVQANFGDRLRLWEVFASRGMGYAASTRATDDVAPVPDTSLPPDVTGGPVGSVAGVVRDAQTGAAIPGALVAFAGHDSGLGDEDLSTETAANGSYRIDGVPARTWDFVTVAPQAKYDRTTFEDVAIAAGGTVTRNFALRRNWALASGGARLASYSGTPFDTLGCGPSALIDGGRRGVWSTESPTNSADPGEKQVTIELPQPITLGDVTIDPSAGCGDPAAAALRSWRLEVSADGRTYVAAGQGVFGSANVGRSNLVALAAHPDGVRYVRLRALSTQGASQFIDVAELQVFSQKPAVVVSPPPDPPPPPPPAAARLTLVTKRAKLGRNRVFAWRVKGPKGALVRARFTVRVRRGTRTRRIVLAKARFRLSRTTGAARARVRVSRRTMRSLRSRKYRVAVTARASGQRRTGTLRLSVPRRR
jgi:hypothetical protein